jgi:type 2 lantibiotic biosynthesis protein LanM
MAVLEKTKKIPKEIKDLPFVDAFWPWVQETADQVKEKAKKELGRFTPTAFFLMQKSLLSRLHTQCAPSFALELSIAKLHQTLEGKTARARYLDFVRKTFLDKEGARTFFDEYKELERQIENIKAFWGNQSVEFLKRLDNDFPLLEQFFNEGKALGKVVSVEQNWSDFHNGGRSVYHVKFESGKELFYKPKDLSFVVTFHAFLEDLSKDGLFLDLKGYRVLSRGEEYGWEEKVEHFPCENAGQVSRYFERAGMLLCLLYLLDGTDVHFENLIAAGEHPIIIDYETFFQTTFRGPEREEIPEILGHSVLKTAVLPTFVEREGDRGPDISALTGEPDSFAIFTWKKVNTDEMERVQEKTTEASEKHHVKLDGVVQSALSHVDEITRGFEKMYQFLAERKSKLTMKGGWIDRLAEFPGRMIVRATVFYGYILERLSSPPILLHEMEREKEMGLLSKWMEKEQDFLNPVLEDEKRSLSQGDVPYFFIYPKRKDIYSTKKELIVSDCLQLNAYQKVIERIESMRKEDCQNQLSLIRQSFLAKKALLHSQKDGEKLGDISHLEKRVSDEEILNEVTKLGEQLEESAFRSAKGGLNWITLEPNPQHARFSLQPITDNLYGGKVGLSLFFSALFAMTHEKKWKEAALNSLIDLRHQIKKDTPRITRYTGIGGMSGSGSLIYGLCKISKLLHEPSLLEEAQKVASTIEKEEIEKDLSYDVIAGGAGLILSLLSLWEEAKDKHLLDLAKHSQAHLLAKAEEVSDLGVGWKTFDNLPHLGFSHGVAGIAYALARLQSFIGKEDKVQQTIKRALDYERALFCPENKGWPRLSSEYGKSYPVQWCHGAVGVGFGRLASLPYFKDEKMMQEIELVVNETQKKIFTGENWGLCCGECGRVEFLIEASKLFPEAQSSLDNAAGKLLARYKKQPPYSPSFMQGVSGIGYTLLRLIDKKKLLPQVLIME